ncbi:hypothetical protein EVAR_65175_1 [Eumeta japonica]|uniref:Uncharacterized protein n=1 Tax=Eumeta variegata TaxID=151549 RepID=A0A4C1ZKE9_EUMVA|nr:hypothetical protein EVAR_65175_1 [Eumeta japonica]
MSSPSADAVVPVWSELDLGDSRTVVSLTCCCDVTTVLSEHSVRTDAPARPLPVLSLNKHFTCAFSVQIATPLCPRPSRPYRPRVRCAAGYHASQRLITVTGCWPFPSGQQTRTDLGPPALEVLLADTRCRPPTSIIPHSILVTPGSIVDLARI